MVRKLIGWIFCRTSRFPHHFYSWAKNQSLNFHAAILFRGISKASLFRVISKASLFKVATHKLLLIWWSPKTIPNIFHQNVQTFHFL